MTTDTLNQVDEDTRYLCENIDGEWNLITATYSQYSGELMLAVLESTYPMAWFELLSDCPKARLDETDYDAFYAYRHELIRPAPKVYTKPKLLVIDGDKV